jgi:hypothetical protein
MSVIRTYFSIILLAIVSFSIVPKEFIHELYGHNDSIENEYSLKGVLHFESVHHHCEMLNYAAFPYIDASLQLQFLSVPLYFIKPVTKLYGFVKLDRYNLAQFRAPPVA